MHELTRRIYALTDPCSFSGFAIWTSTIIAVYTLAVHFIGYKLGV